MKRFCKYIIALTAALSAPSLASAQMTIDRPKPQEQSNVSFRDSIKAASIDDNEYFSEARYKAERRALRKERNTLEIMGSLQGSLTAYNDPWITTSGGDNTTAVLGSFRLNHAYKRDKMTLTSKIAANLGFNRVKIDTGVDDAGNAINEGVWYKNQDELSVSVAPTISISPVWSYGMTFAFRTQFADGYVSRSQQDIIHLKSGFMSPGYIDISGGMTYKSPNKKLPFTVNIAPLALSAVYVSDEVVRQNFRYQFKDHEDANKKDVEPYGLHWSENSKYEGGSSIQVNFDRTFDKLAKIRYTTSLFSFYGWMTQVSYGNIINDRAEYEQALKDWKNQDGITKPILGIKPTVRWENTISIPATDVLSTTIKFQLYYNRAQTEKIQTQTYLSVGLSYTYKNK